MTDSYREWAAFSVLGALSADERLEFERHLEKCDRCRASAPELAGIPWILAKLPVAVIVVSLGGLVGIERFCPQRSQP